MGSTNVPYKGAEAQCSVVASVKLTSSASKLAFLLRLCHVTDLQAFAARLRLCCCSQYARFNNGVSLQAANVESPVQDSLESSFFGSSAARHMLKPGGGALYPALSNNKPLVLPNTGWPLSVSVVLLGLVSTVHGQ